MAEFRSNTIEEIDEAYKTLQATFRAGTTRPFSWRKHQLNQVILMLRENVEAIAQAAATDLRKPRQEIIVGEVGLIIRRATKSVAQLDEWASDETVPLQDWQQNWSATLLKRPKGVVFVISPWNYPVLLSFQPMLGAIAAGCPAVLKPSEISPATSSLFADLFPKYLDHSAYRVINGAVPEVTYLLKLKWDHITYTGNGVIARIVAKAAAEHLTPVTLELGGKSPVVIDPNTTNLKIAAKRVLYGKTLNAGQICIAPDYVLIPRSAQDEFVEAIKEAAVELRHDNVLMSDYSSIVSDGHFKRLRNLMTKSSAEIVLGGNFDEQKRRIAPTVYRDVKEDDSLLEGEIFGPVLPIVPVDDIRQAIESGGLHFNDVVQPATVDGLPFAGVGESGYGYQALKYSYDEFTYLRSSVEIPFAAEPDISVRYPPYIPAITEALTVKAGVKEAPAPEASL
ncbi:aldehyde dehydrogenase [Russula emetica]|nr:aldehyde dehydrogenase [Russula emetica]